MQPSEINNAFHLLAQVPATRTAEILDHQNPPSYANTESDTENDSDSPLFDSFYNEGGSAAI